MVRSGYANTLFYQLFKIVTALYSTIVILINVVGLFLSHSKLIKGYTTMQFGCCCLYLRFKHAVLGTHFSYLGCLSRTTI